jgi:predicted metal-dependent hydrolase
LLLNQKARRENWIKEKIEELSKKPKRLLAHYSVQDYKENRDKAYEVAWNKVLHFNKFYKYDIGKIYIRNQKTRWGSCSGKKNLNFNYKIVFLPEELKDYIIVHELCHLKEMNHSQNFWNLVAQMCPDYRKACKEIKLY